MAITSITITRKAQRTWSFLDDEQNKPIFASMYTGVLEGDNISISSQRGGLLYNFQNFGVFTYVDEVDPSNSFTPVSAEQLFTFLNELEGFFYKGNLSSGGSGGVDYLVDLLDVNIATLLGNAGKALVINSTGTAVIAETVGGVTSITQLQEWETGNSLLPNKYIATNADGTKLIQAAIEQIINTPIAVDEFRVVEKGSQGGNPNIEPYVKEVGDKCEGVSSTDWCAYRLEYNGGDETLLSSYTVISKEKANN